MKINCKNCGKEKEITKSQYELGQGKLCKECSINKFRVGLKFGKDKLSKKVVKKPAKATTVTKKHKELSVTKLKEKLMLLVKEYVKQRDNYTCQHCGKKVSGSDCQASHVHPVSGGNVLSFNPLNMKVLCYHCHLNWWHKNPREATKWFNEKFPDRAEFIDANKHNIVKWKVVDYEAMIDSFKKYASLKKT